MLLPFFYALLTITQLALSFFAILDKQSLIYMARMTFSNYG